MAVSAVAPRLRFLYVRIGVEGAKYRTIGVSVTAICPSGPDRRLSSLVRDLRESDQNGCVLGSGRARFCGVRPARAYFSVADDGPRGHDAPTVRSGQTGVQQGELFRSERTRLLPGMYGGPRVYAPVIR